MRVRLVLAVALVLLGAAVVLTLTRRTQLSAGNHVVPAGFAATLPPGGELCQPNPDLAPDAVAAQVVVGTYGRPVPRFDLRFLDPGGRVLAAGTRPAGGREGPISIPIGPARDAAAATRLCLRITGPSKVVLAGVGSPPDPSDEVVDGALQPGRISVVYLPGGGPRRWWSQVGALDRRFGLGKAAFFGTWTLPLCALLLLGAWTAALRLLLREAP
jgi:hypothetical protein